MFLFCFSMVKVVWSACQNKSRAEKARITVLEECFLCLLHDGRFFPCHYSLCHHKWERIKKPPHSKLDYIPVFNFLLGEKLFFFICSNYWFFTFLSITCWTFPLLSWFLSTVNLYFKCCLCWSLFFSAVYMGKTGEKESSAEHTCFVQVVFSMPF